MTRSMRSLLVLAALLTSACAGRESAPPAAPREAVRVARSDSNEAYMRLEVAATDPTYGYKQENPIKVGGFPRQGPMRERHYLNSLRGPQGQPIEYSRGGSCCPFETSNGYQGMGLLDAYAISYEGATEPIVLYLNFYDEAPLMVPVGFTARQKGQ